MEKKMVFSGLIVFLFLSTVIFFDEEVLTRFAKEELLIYTSDYFYDGDFVLSATPGFHNDEFYLEVSVPSIPQATIYWTIDGSDPKPYGDKTIQRGGVYIQISGSLDESGQIFVADRTTDWRNAILMYHSEDWFWYWSDPTHSREGILPVDDVDILQGTAFRFRGFIGDVPVTETVSATYIIEPNATTRFSGVPIVAVTAPYECFLYFYSNTARGHRAQLIFNYEYFTKFEGTYIRQFSLPGSSNLSGRWSRSNEQRSININFSRGELNGVITYPIFENVDQLYRLRLWNGGSFFRDWPYRDSFAQMASSDLNVLFAYNQVAIKFINGEFWGFTNLREHTSNEDFISTRTGLDRGNIMIMDRLSYDLLHEGDEDLWDLFLDEFNYTTQADLSTDEARERLFDEFFDQENFMDYFITNTFLFNQDWPHNNVRMFRAIAPNHTSSNPYGDGRWRFILHDMDAIGAFKHPNSNFSSLYSPEERQYYLRVFNNPTFVREFVDRAHYVLEHYFYPEKLLTLHDEFLEVYRPLLVDMYERFNMVGSVQDSLARFEFGASELEEFLSNREYYYRQQLNHLLERVGLES